MDSGLLFKHKIGNNNTHTHTHKNNNTLLFSEKKLGNNCFKMFNLQYTPTGIEVLSGGKCYLSFNML